MPVKSVSSDTVAVRRFLLSLWWGGGGGGGGQLLSEAALIAPISGLCSFSLSRWDKAAWNESLQATHGIFTKTHACVLQIPDASCPCFSSAVVFLIAILESLTWFVSSQWVTWAERTYMHTVTGKYPCVFIMSCLLDSWRLKEATLAVLWEGFWYSISRSLV